MNSVVLAWLGLEATGFGLALGGFGSGQAIGAGLGHWLWLPGSPGQAKAIPRPTLLAWLGLAWLLAWSQAMHNTKHEWDCDFMTKANAENYSISCQFRIDHDLLKFHPRKRNASVSDRVSAII